MFISSNCPHLQRAKMNYNYDALYEVTSFPLNKEDMPENVFNTITKLFKVNNFLDSPYADTFYNWFINIVSFNRSEYFATPINNWYFYDEMTETYTKLNESICTWLNGFCKLFYSYFLEYGIKYDFSKYGEKCYHNKDESFTEINLNDCYVEQIGLKPVYENADGSFSGFKVNMNLLLKKFDKE